MTPRHRTCLALLVVLVCTFVASATARPRAHSTHSIGTPPAARGQIHRPDPIARGHTDALLSLSNDHINMSFSGATSQLMSFVDSASGTNFLATPGSTDSWWTIQAVAESTPQNQTVRVDLFTPSADGQADKGRSMQYGRDLQTGATNITFTYTDLLVDASTNATLTVTIVVLLPVNASHVEFTVSAVVGAASGTPNVGIETVSFALQRVNPLAMNADPTNQRAAPSVTDFLVLPQGFGVKTTWPTFVMPTGHTCLYPSVSATYQLLMYYFDTVSPTSGIANGPGLMLGAFDPHATTKTFLFTPRSELIGGQFDLSARLTPAGAGQPLPADSKGASLFDFPIFFGVFTGDWYDGSRLYKSWALRNADWATGGLLRDRADYPSWLLDMNLWVNSGWQRHDVFNSSQGEPAVVQQRVTDMATLFNISSEPGAPSLGLHWYEWNQLKFDTHYPEYFPVRDGFQAAVDELQNKWNVRVAPYINGRMFDLSTASWSSDDALRYASKNVSVGFAQTDYAIYEERCATNASFATMCPATAYWQAKIATLAEELIGTYGVSGIYIDQLAQGLPRMCSDPTHDHTIGGGSYWAEGYNEMLTQVRSSFGGHGEDPAFNAILTEGNAESYISKVNVFLALTAYAVNPSSHFLAMAPVFSSVYGGFTVTMGQMFYQTDLNGTFGPDVFAAKFAWHFVEGSQMGWFSLTGTQDAPPMGMYELLMDPHYASEVDLVKRLSTMRSYAKEHLTFGRRTRDLVFTYKNAETNERHTHPRDTKAHRAPYQWTHQEEARTQHQHHAHHAHPPRSHAVEEFAVHSAHSHSASPLAPSSSIRGSSGSPAHDLASALQAHSKGSLVYDAILSSAWLSEVGCTTPTISFGLFFVSVAAAAPEYELAFSIDLRDYDLTDAPGEQWSVFQVAIDGGKTTLGVFPGTSVVVQNLTLSAREVVYLSIEHKV